MGADLYIKTKFKKNQKKYDKLFEYWVGVRNGLPEGSKERDQAQKHVHENYEKMYSVGYFRDSYNNWNLLWQFDMDYWVTFRKFCNKEGDVTPAGAEKLLAKLKSLEPVFEKNMADLKAGKNRVWDFEEDLKTDKKTFKSDKELNRKDAEKYYRKHYEELKKFLGEAIEAKSIIEASI